jgi:hypothetical protein
MSRTRALTTFEETELIAEAKVMKMAAVSSLDATKAVSRRNSAVPIDPISCVAILTVFSEAKLFFRLQSDTKPNSRPNGAGRRYGRTGLLRLTVVVARELDAELVFEVDRCPVHDDEVSKLVAVLRKGHRPDCFRGEDLFPRCFPSWH